jgi:hypothetical protein
MPAKNPATSNDAINEKCIFKSLFYRLELNRHELRSDISSMSDYFVWHGLSNAGEIEGITNESTGLRDFRAVLVE